MVRWTRTGCRVRDGDRWPGEYGVSEIETGGEFRVSGKFQLVHPVVQSDGGEQEDGDRWMRSCVELVRVGGSTGYASELVGLEWIVLSARTASGT